VADGAGDDGLPPVVRLNTPLETIWDVWVRWRALERKHLPYSGGFLEQPESIMADLLQLDSLYETFTRPKE
jgi:hypothetical protein